VGVSVEVSIPIESELDIVVARRQGRELAASLGFSSAEQTLLATAISEVARNIVTFAARGVIVLSRLDDAGRQGIMVVARDQGPGIADVAAAMRDGYTTRNSLGAGLPGARRLVDEFELVSTLDVGTTVTLKKWRR
jgi:serine/threonine-protein kinase RsbT